MYIELAPDPRADGHEGAKCSATLNHHFADIVDKFSAAHSLPVVNDTY